MTRIGFATVALLVSAVASAQNINEISCRIAASNPEIGAVALPARAEAYRTLGENTLSDPEIEVEQLWGGRQAGNKLTVGVSQEFSFPTVYGERREVAGTQLKAIESLQRAKFLDKALEAKLTILEIVFTRQSVATLDRLKANLDSLEKHYTTSYKGGELTVLDLNKLAVEKIALDQRISALRMSEASLLSSLSSINSGHDASSLIAGIDTYPVEKLLSLGEYKRIAQEQNPMLDYNEINAQAKTHELNLLKAERLPSFSVGYVFNREEGISFNGFKLGVSLPLYSVGNKRESVILERESLLTDNLMMEISTNADIEGTYSNASELKSLITRYSEVLDNDNNIAILKKALDGGVITLLQYLQECNYFLEAELTMLQSRYEYASALAKLNRYDLLQPVPVNP